MAYSKKSISSVLVLLALSGADIQQKVEVAPVLSRAEAVMNQRVYSYAENALADQWKNGARNVASAVMEESRRNGFDPLLLLALIQHESQFNPEAIGSHGEIGLMQIKPDTAEWVARKNHIEWYGAGTLNNPIMNIRIGTAYLKMLRTEFSSNKELYLAAYNMGSRNVRRNMNNNVRPVIYAGKVISNYRRISRTRSHPSSL